MRTPSKRDFTRITLASLALVACAGVQAQGKDLVIGFATAKSGWLEAYDTPAHNAAMIRIDEINAAGGLLGRRLRVVEADSKTDRAQSAKAGLEVLDKGAEMVVTSCDYDFGAPAAIEAQKKGKVAFFLCAEDIKAGLQGVGKLAFTGSLLNAVQGATIIDWAYARRKVRSVYVLEDTAIEYNKGICKGFASQAKGLADLKIVGQDSFRSGDASIAAQISRIKALPQAPDAIMLCSVIPAAASAVKQLRAAGINALVLNGSAVDGSYWLDSVPGLSNFVLPVQGSVHGDDPNPKVEAFNKTYATRFGGRPSSTYVFPGYILIDLWAKAVERAKTTDGPAVAAQLEKMSGEPTLFGPRSFSPALHIQNNIPMLISEIKGGKPGIVDKWQLAQPFPVAELARK